MNYQIKHTSRYKYDDQISHCYNMGHMLPRNTVTQSCVKRDILITPTPSTMMTREDYFGNQVCHFSIQREHLALEVTVNSEVEVSPPTPLTLNSGLLCGEVYEELVARSTIESLKMVEFMVDSPLVKQTAELRAYAEPSFEKNRPFLDSVMEFTQRIHSEFRYDPDSTDVATPLHEVLHNKHGVCQDFAHVAIGCLRSLGFACRYVSGYIETLPPPGQEKLVGSDASHAWFSVYVPGSGWFDFDPTNNKASSEQHITTAWGRDFSDVTPLKGVIFGGGSKQMLEISVDVTRTK